MFDPRVLLISMIIIEISSIFILEVSIIFVHFLNYADFIIYIFKMIMIFFLFAELISTKIIKIVLSEYKI